ncbi:hypothetical protein EI555_013992 [Monodon monoceros]|uniref:Uncharacterized protein n=1 Tax=Monodon monoceros TaxID=40151 RepID=A0A4U1EF76_MONMO|nr:hypothetical protein EI555_013992 [Monodon monoceros]
MQEQFLAQVGSWMTDPNPTGERGKDTTHIRTNRLAWGKSTGGPEPSALLPERCQKAASKRGVYKLSQRPAVGLKISDPRAEEKYSMAASQIYWHIVVNNVQVVTNLNGLITFQQRKKEESLQKAMMKASGPDESFQAIPNMVPSLNIFACIMGYFAGKLSYKSKYDSNMRGHLSFVTTPAADNIEKEMLPHYEPTPFSASMNESTPTGITDHIAQVKVNKYGDTWDETALENAEVQGCDESGHCGWEDTLEIGPLNPDVCLQCDPTETN